MKKIVVLISGSGSNLEAIINACESKKDTAFSNASSGLNHNASSISSVCSASSLISPFHVAW